MKIYTALNQKGGCGKSHLSVLITFALSSIGKNVLSVDCDPQGGMTSFLNENDLDLWEADDEEDKGLFELLTLSKKPEEIILKLERHNLKFDLIPANYQLDDIAPTVDPFSLKRLFKDKFYRKYDYIVLDTPPTLQGISRAAAFIADKVFVPTEISKGTLKPTKNTLNKLLDMDKYGFVVFMGYKEPKPEQTGYKAKLSRKFIRELGDNVIGNIPKNVTVEKSVADPNIKWTKNKIKNLLAPIIDFIEDTNAKKAI